MTGMKLCGTASELKRLNVPGGTGHPPVIVRLCEMMMSVLLLVSFGTATSVADESNVAAADTRIAERDRLWQEAQSLATDGRTAEAIKVGEQVLKIELDVFGDVHKELTGTLKWLSQKHRALQQMKRAFPHSSGPHFSSRVTGGDGTSWLIH